MEGFKECREDGEDIFELLPDTWREAAESLRRVNTVRSNNISGDENSGNVSLSIAGSGDSSAECTDIVPYGNGPTPPIVLNKELGLDPSIPQYCKGIPNQDSFTSIQCCNQVSFPPFGSAVGHIPLCVSENHGSHLIRRAFSENNLPTRGAGFCCDFKEKAFSSSGTTCAADIFCPAKQSVSVHGSASFIGQAFFHSARPRTINIPTAVAASVNCGSRVFGHNFHAEGNIGGRASLSLVGVFRSTCCAAELPLEASCLHSIACKGGERMVLCNDRPLNSVKTPVKEEPPEVPFPYRILRGNSGSKVRRRTVVLPRGYNVSNALAAASKIFHNVNFSWGASKRDACGQKFLWFSFPCRPHVAEICYILTRLILRFVFAVEYHVSARSARGRMLSGIFRGSMCLPLSCLDLCGVSPSKHDVYPTRANCPRMLCSLDNSVGKVKENDLSNPDDLLLRFLRLFEELHTTEARHEILREELSLFQEFLLELQRRQGAGGDVGDAAKSAGMCSIEDLRELLPKRLRKIYQRKLSRNPWSIQSHTEAVREAVPLLNAEIDL